MADTKRIVIGFEGGRKFEWANYDAAKKCIESKGHTLIDHVNGVDAELASSFENAAEMALGYDTFPVIALYQPATEAGDAYPGSEAEPESLRIMRIEIL